MKDRIAKSVFWIVWSRGGVQVLAFLSTILVARMLQPSDYGVMALAGIWIATLDLVIEMGLGAAIVQFRDLKDPELNACFWLTMGIASTAYIVLCLFSSSIAIWFASPRLAELLPVLGITVPIAAIAVVPDSLLRKRLALDKISQAEIVAALLTIPVMLGMAWYGFGVWALVAGTMVLTSVQTILIFRFQHWWPGFHMAGARVGKVLRYSSATLGSKICWALYKQADVFVLGKAGGEIAVGIYAMAKQLALLPVTKVSAVINVLASPVMAELQANREALAETFLRGIRLVACVTFPLSTGLFVLADDVVRVALTDKWISVVPLIRVLCLYAVIRSVDILLPPLLMARYRTKFLLVYSMALLVVMSLAFWVGATWWGALGVALAWVIAYPVIMLWMVREALHEVGLRWKQLWIQMWTPMVASLVMLAVMTVVHVGSASVITSSGIARLILVGLTGLASYIVCLLGLGGPVWLEIQEVLGWLVGRFRAVPAAK